MVLFNYSTKELTAKVVYYGPGLCGKTTNLQWIHEKLPIKNKGKMLSLATETDRTLFFDFLPIELGTIRGHEDAHPALHRARPGLLQRHPPHGAEGRRLRGVRGRQPGADARRQPGELGEPARRTWRPTRSTPTRSRSSSSTTSATCPNALPLEILNERLNPRGVPFFEAVAVKGTGSRRRSRARPRSSSGRSPTKYGGGRREPGTASGTGRLHTAPEPRRSGAASARPLGPRAAAAAAPTAPRPVPPPARPPAPAAAARRRALLRPIDARPRQPRPSSDDEYGEDLLDSLDFERRGVGPGAGRAAPRRRLARPGPAGGRGRAKTIRRRCARPAAATGADDAGPRRRRGGGDAPAHRPPLVPERRAWRTSRRRKQAVEEISSISAPARLRARGGGVRPLPRRCLAPPPPGRGLAVRAASGMPGAKPEPRSPDAAAGSADPMAGAPAMPT